MLSLRENVFRRLRLRKINRRRKQSLRRTDPQLAVEWLEDRRLLTNIDIIDVAPDPRNQSMDTVDVVFAVPIVGSSFDYQDVMLTRDGGSNLVTSAVSVNLVSGNTYRISGLTSLTSADGNYTITVDGTGITPANPVNLIQNPGFELDSIGDLNPDFWSWTEGDRVKAVDLGITPHSGSRQWQFQSFLGGQYKTSLSQVVTVTEAGSYELSMWIANRNHVDHHLNTVASGQVKFDLLNATSTPIVPSSSVSSDYDTPRGTYVLWTRTFNNLTPGTYTVRVATGVGTGANQGMADDFSLALLGLGGLASDVWTKSTNSPPAVAANAAAVSVNEGGTATNAGTFSDSQGNATVALSASVGTVTQDHVAGTWNWSLGTNDGPSQTQTVTITAADSDGASSSTMFQLTVNNVNPTATFSNGGAVDEGSFGIVSFSNPFDPSTADSSFRYAYDFDNNGTFEVGNGTYGGSSLGAQQTVPASYLTDGPASRIVRGRIIDKDGGFTDYTTTITVNNVAPTLVIPSTIDLVKNGEFESPIAPLNSFTTVPIPFWTNSADGNAIELWSPGLTVLLGAPTIGSDGNLVGQHMESILSNFGAIRQTIDFSSLPSGATVNSLQLTFDAWTRSFGTATYDIFDATTGTSLIGGARNVSSSTTAWIRNTAPLVTSGIDTSHTIQIVLTPTSGNGGANVHFDQVALIAGLSQPGTPTVTVNEGQTASIFNGSFSDPGINDNVVITAPFGTITQTSGGSGSFSWSWVATDGPGQSQSVAVTARDKDGATSTSSFNLVVNNVAPTASRFTSGGAVNEGSTGTVAFAGQFDPSSVDTAAGFRYAYDFDNNGTFDSGNGTYAGSGTAASVTVPASFLSDGPGTRTVRGRIIDKDGGFTDYTTTITINNVAPTATFGNSGAVNEGSVGSVSFSNQFDPSSVDTSAGFRYAYDFDNNGIWDAGNGTYAGSVSSASATVPASFLADGPGSRTVRARIIDRNDGFTQYTTTITVLNVAPTFEAGADETVQPPQLGAFSRSGIQIADPGNPEAFSGTVNFGDGTGNQTLTINQATRQFSLSHTYPNTNAAPAIATYHVTVTVSDGDGGSHTDTFDVTVNLNTPPVAEDDSVTMDEDHGVTFSVLTNDQDNQNNIVPSLTTNLTSPAAGVLTNNQDGTFSFDPHGAFEHLAVGESATVSFDYQVVDAFGESDTGTVTITITGVNDGPSVSVGSTAVTVDEGQTAGNSGSWSDIDTSDVVTLTASVGTVTKNANGTWSWSFNTNDGPDQSQTVTITADDGNGGIATISFDLTVNNVAPDAVNDSYSTSQATLLTGNVITGGGADTDPAGANDPLTVVAVNGVASNVGQAIALSNGMLTVNADGSFSYQPDTTFVGTESFTYTISDGDGGLDSATVTIVVNAAAGGSILTVVDTCCDGGTALLITGTSANDHIVVAPGSASGTLQVNVNGVISTIARPSGRIIVLGLAGNDNIQIAGAISNSVWLYGDEGDDRLNAGNANPGGNLLFGGDGNDDLLGGSGRDVLIGGQGADKITANAGDDILIAGLTTHDARDSAAHEDFWCNVLHEWTELDPFATRVNRLRNGSGHTGANLLASVLDDNSANQIDQLQGSSGDDWFLFRSGEDKITGQTEASN